MKKKFLSKLLTMLLVVSMMFTMLPASAIAYYDGGWSGLWNSRWNTWLDDSEDDTVDEQDDEMDIATQATNDDYYRIVHLDCGRKYFSVDQIEAIIDAMYLNGFNQLQLAFGNGGLRFVLEDMDLTAVDESLTSENVKSAILEGNNNYYEESPDALTEKNMKEIIEHASAKGIEIVPLLNMPGHMNGLLSSELFAAYRLDANGTTTGSLNLNNEKAREVGLGLLELYLNWFAENGNSKYFNFGADEYAHEAQNPYFGWSGATVQYSQLASYMNECISKIAEAVSESKNESMVARCFNDFVYYSGNAAVSKDVQVCYWSNQWSDSVYKEASELAKAGYNLINTNQNWYYVPGTSTGYKYSVALKGIQNYDVTRFRNTGNDGQSISADRNIGAMFCVWCDHPEEVAFDAIDEITALIDAMADNNTSYFTKRTVFTVVGGDSDATAEKPATASVAANKSITLKANDVVTWSYDPDFFTLADSDTMTYASFEAYVGNSITLIPTGTTGNSTVTATNVSGEKVTIAVAVTEAQYITKDVYVSIGGISETFEHKGSFSAIGGDSSIATAIVTAGTQTGGTERTLGDVLKTGTGVLYVNGHYLVVDSNGIISDTDDINKATEVTVTSQRVNYYDYHYYIAANGHYLALSDGDLTTFEQSNQAWWLQGDGLDYYRNDSGEQYLACDNGTWKIENSWQNSAKLYSFTKTTQPSGEITKVSFAGVAKGTTEYIVDNTKYIVHVSDIPADATNLYVDFWVTSNPVTPDGVDSITAGSKTEQHIYVTYRPEEFNTEEGVLLSEKMPSTGTYTAQGEQLAVSYWKTRYLPVDVRQYADGWTNKNGVGTDTKTEAEGGRDIERIRYQEGKWQYKTANNSNWISFTTSSDGKGDQIAAYYLIKTNVTKEVTTYVTDWTDPQDTSFWGVALDFCVKYPSQDTREPSTFKNSNTQWFNCIGEEDLKHASYQNGYCIIVDDDTREKLVGSWEGLRTEYPDKQGDWYRVINNISVTEDQGYEVYMITATPSESFNDATNGLSCPDTIKYTGTETVLWAENDSVVTDSGLEKHTDYKVGGSPVIERVMIQQCSGMLLTYYVRPKAASTQLKVHFREQGSNEDFASYYITPLEDSQFNPEIALPDGENHIGELKNATILNDRRVEQTVTSDLTKVPSVAAKYRRSSFKCVGLEKSEDLTEIILYYTFDNTATFVVDFGLSLKLEPTDVNPNLSNATIKSAQAQLIPDGLSVNTIDPEKVVITPTAEFVKAQGGITFSLEYTGILGGKESTVPYLVTVIPASNVLYEENFLTPQGTGTGGISWQEGGNVVATTTAQQPQKVNGDGPYNVFGYDVAYAGKTGDSGYWKLGDAADAAKQLQYSKFYSTYLKTTFYGNGFDLIGNCGPDTGRVIAVLTNTSTDETYIGDVDTRYTDGSETTLYQVPLMHMELPEGIYSVKIYGGGLDKTEVTVQGNSAAQNSISTQSMAMPVYSYDAMLESVLRANDLTMSDVEYVKVSSADSAAASAASSSAFATYAATNDAAETKTITHEAGTHVEIDGFRVYRSTDNSNYPEAEKNVKYVNVLDAVGEIVAYREGDQAGNNSEAVNIQDYEATGGPQNEIYLTGEQAVIFAIEGLSAEDKVQVSLRAASGSAANTGKAFATNTELYYELSPMSLNGRTVYVVANTSDGILAVGNFKLPNNAAVITASKLPTETVTAAYSMAMNAAPVDPEPEQPLVFEPEYFHIRDYATRLFRSKLVTLRIDFSSDVSYVTIDGVRYNPSRLASLFGYHTVTFTDTVGRNDVYLYKIVFYDANGNPSATQLVYGN